MNVQENIPTRKSLLGRLKNWNDQESWREFFDTYWRLIYGAARRAGLTDSEAQDVVQETVITVCKGMPKFDYDPAKGSFKNRLLTVTNWRIIDCLEKRLPVIQRNKRNRARTSTDTVERLPDPAGSLLEAAWDKEWETNLMEAAIERVKRRIDPKFFQVFDLSVAQEWPVSRVAVALRMNRARIYVIKHRVIRSIQKEVRRLRAKRP